MSYNSEQKAVFKSTMIKIHLKRHIQTALEKSLLANQHCWWFPVSLKNPLAHGDSFSATWVMPLPNACDLAWRSKVMLSERC